MGPAKISYASLILCLFSTALVFWPSIAIPQNDKIPTEVMDRADAHGAVLVLVGLNVAWTMESSLSESGIAAQRNAIDGAQNGLLSELSGTRYRIIRRYDAIPGIALEVGPDALAVLKKSDSVTNVLPDRPVKPAASDVIAEGLPSARSVEATGSAGVVPAELFAEATTTGAVLVLVGLKTPWRPEGPLSVDMVHAQREAIAAAQNYLLTELADTTYRITRRYQVIPGIALEVGLDALRVLARSAAVTNVLRDRPALPLH